MLKPRGQTGFEVKNLASASNIWPRLTYLNNHHPHHCLHSLKRVTSYYKKLSYRKQISRPSAKPTTPTYRHEKHAPTIRRIRYAILKQSEVNDARQGYSDYTKYDSSILTWT